MALLDTTRTEFPQSAVELEAFDLLRTEGRRYHFRSKDGSDDVINGVFQLKLSKTIGVGIPFFGFEQFKAEQSQSPNGSVRSNISQVNNNFSVLEFQPNKKKVGIAFCPDTRNNRNLLADIYFEKKYVIDGLLTENGAIDAVTARKEIEALALKRKAARQSEANSDMSDVDRMLSNLSPEKKDYFVKKFVEMENQKKAPLVAPILAPAPVTENPAVYVTSSTQGVSKSTATSNAAVSAVQVSIMPAVIAPDIPKPEGSFKHFTLKAEAKKAIVDHASNSLAIEALKKEFGVKWNSCNKYKATIQPQIDSLLERWTKAVTV